ncbi:Rad9-domain-containing protein [Chlamydoabsidia padenii]|nr:Rad9-domain-containing protein [Chlamydoabsidia padenii]
MSFSVALPPNALKALGHGLEALIKFGDEVNIDAKRDQLILWTVNTSITGQAILRMSPRLFERYVIRPSADSQTTNTSCRLLLKTLQKIIKNNQHRSSGIKQCELKLNGGRPTSSRTTGGLTGAEHRLHVKFEYENGMTKTNSLWYTDAEFSSTLFTKDMPYSFTIDPGLFYDYIALMDNRIQDLSFIFSPAKVIIKTFWDSSIGGQATSRPMQSQFKISNQDFASYNVNVETMLTVSMKEFKTAVNYSMDTGDLLKACFEESGKPIVFTVEQRGFVIADFAVMTYAGNDGIAQSSGLSMNDNSIVTEDTALSIPRPSTSYASRNHHRHQHDSSSTEREYSAGPSHRQSDSEREYSAGPSRPPIIDSSPSLDMIPPSFEQQKKPRNHDSIDDNDDPLFPFGTPPITSTTRSSLSRRRQHSPPQQQQYHASNNVRVNNNDSTTDDEEELFVDQNRPKAKKRFFDSNSTTT